MKRDDRPEVFRPARHSKHDEDDADAFEGGEDLGDDLRYEGPISLEDEGADVSEGAGGKVFLTAAILGAAVILILGVALVLRRDDRPAAPVTTAATRPAPLSGPTAPGTMPGDTVRVTPEGQAFTGSAGAEPAVATSASTPAFPAPPSALESPAPAGLREEPAGGDELLEGDSPPPVEIARAEPADDRAAEEPAHDRPAPAPARAVAKSEPAPAAHPAPVRSEAADAPAKRPAPAPAKASTAAAVRDDAHALVAAGRIDDAARAGQARAQRGGWALQLMLACDVKSVGRAFAAVGSDELYVVPAKGRDGCYKVLWGRFADRDAAAAARPRVPSHFSKAGPAVPVALAQVSGS